MPGVAENLDLRFPRLFAAWSLSSVNPSSHSDPLALTESFCRRDQQDDLQPKDLQAPPQEAKMRAVRERPLNFKGECDETASSHLAFVMSDMSAAGSACTRS